MTEVDAPRRAAEILTDEILNRQVCQEEMGAERINTPAFVPTEAQNWLLSTLRGRVDPVEALTQYNNFASDSGSRLSVGTWPISVAHARTLVDRVLDDGGLVEYDNGLVDTNPIDHASVDFRGLTRSARERVGKRLRDEAVKKGYLHLRADLVPRFSWATPLSSTV